MVKAHDKLAKNSEKLLKNMEKVRKNLNFGQNRLGRGWLRQRKDSESAAEIYRMGIRAEVGWSIWREQVTWLAERILLRISMG